MPKTPSFARIERRQSNLIEWTLVFICLLTGLAGLRMTSTGNYWTKKNQERTVLRPIGILVREKGSVRHRPQYTVAWRDVGDREHPISSGDTVFTGETGFAEVKLNSTESSAKVLPNSLITIHPEEAQTTEESWLSLAKIIAPKPTRQILEIKRGNVAFQFRPNTKKLRIKAHNEEYQLEALSNKSSFEIAVTPSQTGTKVTLSTDPGSEVKISSTSSKAIAITVASGKKVVLNEPSPEVTIGAGIFVKPVAPQKIDSVFPVPESGTDPLPILSPVIAKPVKNAKVRATERKAVIRPTPPPSSTPAVPTLTVNSSSISTRLRSGENLQRIPVTLEWKPIDGATEYEIIVYDGSDMLIKRTVRQPRLDFALTSISENFSYEVIAKMRSNARIFSKRVPISLELAVPVPQTPAQGQELRIKKDVLITWQRTLVTEKYELQIASDSDVSNILVAESVSKNYFRFVPKSAGQYHWRVKSLSGNHSSHWSQSRSFKVKELLTK